MQTLVQVVRTYSGSALANLRLSAPKRAAGAKKPPAPLRAGLVEDYRRQVADLRVRSPELTTLFAKLDADKKMRVVEMASLANLVAYETAASTKRPEALRRVKQRHEAYLTSAAKSDAIKGSSAT